MKREEAIGLLTNMKGYTHITLYEWLDVEKEAIDMAIEALSAVCDDCIWHVCNYNKVDWDTPSAEAEPTVIRSKTLMPTKDFKEWAKRVREENPNAVIIPCDAEVPSAEAVYGEWIDIDNHYRLATCSNCHKVTMFEKWGAHTKPYDFCPNCGARMKGGDDE